MRVTRRSLLIGALLMGAACLRLVNLGSQGLFFDEAWSWAASRLSLSGLYHLALTDPHPPLYYLLLKLILWIIPPTQLGLRLLSVFLSIATLSIVLVYVSSRWSLETTFYVGLLIGLSPFDIYYAQEARMYSLLAFLWVASYLALVKGMDGDRKYLYLWPITAILMAWTHLYGVLVALILAVWAAMIWGSIWKRLNKIFPLSVCGFQMGSAAVQITAQGWGRLGLSAACVLIGSLPPLALALSKTGQDAGGAWVPALSDIYTLFLTFSAGLAAVRAHFIDSAHLVLPFLASLPTSAWIAVGLAVSGLPAAWGLISTWRDKPDRRAQAGLAVVLMVLPAALALGYGIVTRRQVWAIKPFLGAAVLFYIWAGVGIGALKSPLLRRGLGAAVILLALSTLLPYFTQWQKSDSAGAFHSLPVQAAQVGVIIEPPYLSPVAFYYLGDERPVYALVADGEGKRALVRITPTGQDKFGLRQPAACASLPPAGDLWVWGYTDHIQATVSSWPACVTSRRVWIYQDGAWQILIGR